MATEIEGAGYGYPCKIYGDRFLWHFDVAKYRSPHFDFGINICFARQSSHLCVTFPYVSYCLRFYPKP